MATLNAMIDLLEGYSTTVVLINKKVRQVSEKILKASRDIDKINKKLSATGASSESDKINKGLRATGASNGPNKLNKKLKATGASANTKKAESPKLMSITDIAKGAVKGFSRLGDFINKGVDLNLIDKEFADVWDRIESAGTQAFTKVMEKVYQLINLDGFKQFANGVITAFDLAAEAAIWLIDAIVNGWDTIGPILGIIGAVYLAAVIRQLISMIPLWVANIGAVLALAWPVLLVVGIIGLVIAAARYLGASWEQIFGFIGGVLGVFAAYFYNKFVSIWNVVAAFINFFGNVFSNPIASIKALFYDLMVNVIGFIEKIALGIETLLNKIPGVKVDITSNLAKIKDTLAGASATVKSEAELKEFVRKKDYMDYSDGYTKGSNIGKNVVNTIGDKMGSLSNLMTGGGKDFNKSDTSNDPLSVKGTGANGAIDVNMADEDLQYLRDIAERDYVNKFSTSTLAPNVQITFGDVHEEADANKVAGRIKMILQEEIATVSEGVYDV